MLRVLMFLFENYSEHQARLISDQDILGNELERAGFNRFEIHDALAWLDCTIYSKLDAGTHTLYLGEVQASSVARADEPPLLYWNRGYRWLKTHTESDD